MPVADPIADLLTRIRNALLGKQQTLDAPFSLIKLEIVKILKSDGFIKGYKILEQDNKKAIRIYLKYDTHNEPVIHGLKRISKPGKRVYVNKDKIPRVLSGMGIAILTTSKGVLNDQGCRNNQVGGEVLCHIW